MSIRKFSIAAALMLCAVGASASNFRAADQVYLPIAGHLQGGSGTFISDVYLANLTADEVKVSVIYVPFGPNPPAGSNGQVGQEFRDVITLRPFERKEYRDVFRSALNLNDGFGQLIFNGCKSGTSCGPETQNENGFSPNFRDISVQSRIYQIANNAPQNAPTTGQLFSGIPWYNFISSDANTQGLDRVFITGLTHTGNPGQAGTYRANVGVANASQYSSTTIVVKLYQGTLTEADKRGEYQVNLGPLGNIQQGFATMFPGVAFGGNYFVTVEQRNTVPVGNVPQGCENGCPAFLAYGSVLDNISGDATTMESQFLVPLSGDALDALYPSGSGKMSIRRSVRH